MTLQLEQQETTFQRALKELQKTRLAERDEAARLKADLERATKGDDIGKLGAQLCEANRRVEEADTERERAVEVASQLQITFDELVAKYKSERNRFWKILLLELDKFIWSKYKRTINFNN